MNALLTRLMLVAGLCLSTALFVGCEQDSGIENAAENTKDAMEDAADNTKDAMEDAGDAVKDATDDAADAVKDATN